MPSWNPSAYLRFEYERTLPSRDLAARLHLPAVREIVDVGCGPGNSTAVLKKRWPQARIVGLDSSRGMIDKARENDPDGNWVIADVMTWQTDGRYDVVFSNAVLQWLGDQKQAITRLFGLVREGGALAVQVPQIGASPLHRALLAVSSRPEWSVLLSDTGLHRPQHDEGFYYNHLTTLTARLEMWVTTYLHVMDSHQDILDWYAGTGMRPYLERIENEGARKRFMQQVLEACKDGYPVQDDGKVMFPFRRLFFIAWKDED